MPENYTFAYLGILTILITLVIQSIVAAVSKASQPDAIPGKMDESLGHDSFVFRSNRTFKNSLENISMMLGTAFLAVLVGADEFWTGLLIWVMALARIMHMVLYYAIATKKNPSPRSYFYLLAVLANIGLMGCCALALI